MTPTRFVADTSPYPWPYDGCLDANRIGLLVTGWDPHWAAAAPPSPEVLANIAALADAMPWTATVGHPLPARTSVHAPALRPTVPQVDHVDHVEAAGIDGFWGSRLDALLRSAGRDRLVLAGLGLETTVHSTLRRANDMGLECLVVVDACQSVEPELTAAAVSTIELSGGIFGAVGTAAAVLAALSLPTTDPEDPS